MRLLAFTIIVLLTGCATEQRPQITNYQSKGNLQTLSPIRCVDLTAITNKKTPADIFPGVQDCMNKKDYPRAAKLYALADLYGRVDQLRVTDQSAHQAVAVLRINHLGSFSKDEANSLQNSIMSTAQNTDALKAMCSEIRRLGPPDYYPAYMAQHGMGAFLGGGTSGPVRADFNMAEAWEKSLNGFLHCP